MSVATTALRFLGMCLSERLGYLTITDSVVAELLQKCMVEAFDGVCCV